MKTSHRQSNLSFRLMTMEFCFRDWLHPPITILKDAGVGSDMTVLDFGCGPGGFSIAAAEIVGPKGMVYAVDIHPLALEAVQQRALKRGFKNVATVCGSNITKIDEEAVDVVLLYDVLHDLAEPDAVLKELYRTLKSSGILSVSDHPTDQAALSSLIVKEGLYTVAGRSQLTLQFGKIESGKRLK